jgi:thiol-disulfide isomerase/thioredoxin
MIRSRQICVLGLLSCFFGLMIASTATGQSPAHGRSDHLVLYFQSENCQPCRQLEPLLLEYVASGWDIRKVEATRQLDLSRQYRIENLPTLVLINDGKEVDRIVGLVSSQQLDQRMQRMRARHQGQLAANPNAANPNAVPISREAGSASPIVRGQSPEAKPEGYPLLASRSAQPSLPSDYPANTPPSNLRTVSEPRGATGESSIQSSIAKATDATVRIKVEESNTTAYGTGTIVATHESEALVLTCGHLFRDMLPGSHLKVDLFAGTPRQTTVLAQLIDFKADKEDIGLLSLRLPVSIEPVPILPRSESVQVGQSVFSVGCDHGNDPTRRDTRVTHINRYLGPSNIEIAGAPAVGRSGGGLFDAQGRLIGVCNAACNQDNEGIYASSEVIYEQLSRVGQSHLFEGNKAVAADAPPSGSPSDSPPTTIGTLASHATANDRATANDQVNWPDESAELERLGAVAKGSATESVPYRNDVQLICVLRDSKGADRVVTIDQPSIALLQAIEQHGDRVANR